MGWPKGKPRGPGAGRKGGVPSKKTQYLIDHLERIKLDLPTEIKNLLPELSAKEKADVILRLMEFVFPKRKAVDFYGQSDVTITPHEYLINMMEKMDDS